MSEISETSSLILDNSAELSRRSFFKRAAVVGATGAVAATGLTGLASALTKTTPQPRSESVRNTSGLTSGDTDILVAAEIAEALAVTTYGNIIQMSPFFKTLEADDQNYLRAAHQEEMSHYALEESVTSQPTPFKKFYYPVNMFLDPQTTLNTLVTLEDAFIAAYLVGVRNFSTSDLRVTAARIMGIESDHRTLARVLGGDAGLTKITGAQGVAENVDPPNNNGYERTLCWTDISQAVTALTPFVDASAAKSAGFDTSKAYFFKPFTAVLPNDMGDFISFGGC